MSYKIIHRKQNILFASGFYSLDRAQRWVDQFYPEMYTDKNLKREDLIITKED